MKILGKLFKGPVDDLHDDVIKISLVQAFNDVYNYEIIRLSDNRAVGYIDLRVGHSQTLYYYGNIGYRVYPDYRGHSYAYRACLLVFEVARKMGIDYLLITASPENTPSVVTCEKLGGQLLGVEEVPSWHPLYRNNERVKNIYRYDL